ncbi:MBL fold metallo-hydrolase [Maritalea mediterranea]|uniref:MBL fold metallo-hydrolase n=1 Tax=Maritalea mediterranea TaxID=2909667 RepID=A0ABS9EC39_9HYPH|nr:MBL fold metallo-hydrolase [Maritalea mediterranea]MCF4098988.1 MBL fold metallo-hydrolase [Maritalea mediterranea]
MTYRIQRVPIAPLGMINAFLLQTSKGAVLVDTGLMGTEGKTAGQLKRMGLGWDDLKLIIVTHGHVDHAGGAAKLRALSGAPVVIHEAEAKYCAGEAKMKLCPTGWVGRYLYRRGLPMEPYTYFSPDIVMRDHDELDLRPYGLDGRVIFTPGHTPGSISVLLDDGQAFVSDLLASGYALGGLLPVDRPQRTPFEEEPHEVAKALEQVLEMGGAQFHVGHGFKLSAKAVERHAARLRQL